MEQDDVVVQRLLGVIVRAAQAIDTTDQHLAALLDEASALLWYLKPGTPPLSLATLKHYITLPLEHWLDERTRQGFTGSLRLGGAPSLLCDEILLELDPKKGWERVQAIIAQVRDLCRTREHGEAEYRVFRRFLIEHGVVDVDQTLDFLMPLGVGFTTLFEPIPLHDQKAGMIYLCPSCWWPMRLDHSQVRCGSQWCLETAGVFEWRHEMLISAKYATTVEPQPVENTQRLKTALWKFTLIPGLIELRLYKRFVEMGLHPELWPEVDQADIRLLIGDKKIDLDAKVWASTGLLGNHLEMLDSRETWVIIPDYQKSYVHSLNETCPPNLMVMSESQCVRKVSQLCPR